ncbi:MAG: hypothetical protein PWR27_1945 [Petroclostridium sp.]|jgi:lactobin A/cerein 7B family class IIb bacteriocin|uniref:class IIb bacteriocin, lactobin A/cerein 7B family n=1 Tax=Petroclostridium xylanilyticum TaxID=1792311 RepID=UPI000B98D1D4|nr:class IIb bacteriocin, lactobin A/cerein 7B family [Petroclostridium xylanilyticum]MBZ4647223.1 hypothetical protein [Clostridia bacterium]MDK2811236.1 hypothetical protein [Petroclostridium sp.]
MTNALVLNNNFVELNHDEMDSVNGGVGFVAGLAIGVAVGWVADGILKSTTGKSGGDWVATGIDAVKEAFNSSEAKVNREAGLNQFKSSSYYQIFGN